MAGRKSKGKKITAFHFYETTSDSGGFEKAYTRMTHSQLVAMNELSHPTFRVYIMMKDYAAGKIETEFPHRIYKNIISNGGFQNSLTELVELGYIEPFVSLKNLRKANVYRFSGKWKERHTPKPKEPHK